MKNIDHELIAAERAQQAELDRLDREIIAQRKAQSAAIRAAKSSFSPPPSPASTSDIRHHTSDIHAPLASIHFNPPPDQSEVILSAISGPDFSLRDIAEQHRTTLEALTLWLARPEVQARTAALASACAQRTRLLVANYSVHVARILCGMLDAYEHFENHANFVPGSAYGYEQQRRGRESARKACGQLMRMANFHTDSGTGLPPGVPPHNPNNPPRVTRPPTSPTEVTDHPHLTTSTSTSASESASTSASAIASTSVAASATESITDSTTETSDRLRVSNLTFQISNSASPTPAQQLQAQSGTLPTPPLPRPSGQGAERSEAEGERAIPALPNSSAQPLTTSTSAHATPSHPSTRFTPITISHPRPRPP